MIAGDYYVVGKELRSKAHSAVFECKSEEGAKEIEKRMNDATAKYYKGKRARTGGDR